MAVDKLVDSAQLDAGLTTVANAIRTKGGTSAELEFPNGFASAIASIPSGGTPTLQNKTITANGTYIADVGYDGLGTVIVNVSSSSPTLQSKTVNPSTEERIITADAGYDGLSDVTVNAIAMGTAGTPTATKGAVNNHSIEVTPSVTNITGYITGSTKVGSAVTVNASELVSGSDTKTANGTYDVTNLAELVVAIPVYDGSVS